MGEGRGDEQWEREGGIAVGEGRGDEQWEREGGMSRLYLNFYQWEGR